MVKHLSHFQRFFIVLCLLTVFRAQSPHARDRQPNGLQWIDWGLAQFGHAAGLDNRWEMFSYAHRVYHRLVFIGDTLEEKNILLNIPSQRDQDFFWQWFFSFREDKFLLNIYGQSEALDSYLDYLCEHSGERSLTKIRIEVQRFEILPLAQARQTGQALNPIDPFAMRERTCRNLF